MTHVVYFFLFESNDYQFAGVIGFYIIVNSCDPSIDVIKGAWTSYMYNPWCIYSSIR